MAKANKEIKTTAMNMNIITSIAVTVAIAAISAALYISHSNQSEKIATLSRQLSEVLERDEFDAPLSTLSARRAQELPSAFTYASDFGVVGDSMANDGPAIQAALDSAGMDETGGTVILPQGVFITTQPIIIPAGVTLHGQGYGSSPLAI
eukprot:scaffold21432_cov150-Skeletonema_dohrnii-CCMP3373.AAC.1